MNRQILQYNSSLVVAVEQVLPCAQSPWTRISVTGASFVPTPLSLSVPAGDSAYVQIAFTPASVGTKTASLQLAHNASGSPTAITLTGTGGQSVTDISDTLSFTSDDGSKTKVKFK